MEDDYHKEPGDDPKVFDGNFPCFFDKDRTFYSYPKFEPDVHAPISNSVSRFKLPSENLFCTNSDIRIAKIQGEKGKIKVDAIIKSKDSDEYIRCDSKFSSLSNTINNTLINCSYTPKKLAEIFRVKGTSIFRSIYELFTTNKKYEKFKIHFVSRSIFTFFLFHHPCCS